MGGVVPVPWAEAQGYTTSPRCGDGNGGSHDTTMTPWFLDPHGQNSLYRNLSAVTLVDFRVEIVYTSVQNYVLLCTKTGGAA